MKIKPWSALLGLIFFLSACEDDSGGYTNVKGIENLIYQEIKSFREAEGQTGPFVLQYPIVKEAQLYSYKMANGIEEVGIQGIDEHWETLDDFFTFYNRSSLVLKTMSSKEEDILEELLAVPGVENELLEDLTQCGVGVEQDADGFNYITIMLAKAD